MKVNKVSADRLMAIVDGKPYRYTRQPSQCEFCEFWRNNCYDLATICNAHVQSGLIGGWKKEARP